MSYKGMDSNFTGYLGPKPDKETYKYFVENDRVVEVHNVMVHEFMLHDAEDPDLYAAEPLIKWRDSEMGTWVMEHAVESPTWYKVIDPVSYGYRYQIRARLRGPDFTFYQLKWGNQ